jgi:hypothetical protein
MPGYVWSSAAVLAWGMSELSDEVIAFLTEGTRTGMLGYLASDGRPLVAPVWFIVEAERVRPTKVICAFAIAG